MSFRIRKAFLIPLGLLVIEIITLLISCIMFDQPIGKAIILGVIILPVIILFIECVFRNTIIGDDHIWMRKLLRSKQMNYAEITAVETILVKKRAFITLCTPDEFLIFSNAYSNFPDMVRLLLDKVPAAVVTEETAAMAQNPPTKSTDILSCWMAVVLMGFILYAQLKMFL